MKRPHIEDIGRARALIEAGDYAGLKAFSAPLGGLLWGSLMLTILVASLIGSSLPLLLHRWKVDPAVATRRDRHGHLPFPRVGLS